MFGASGGVGPGRRSTWAVVAVAALAVPVNLFLGTMFVMFTDGCSPSVSSGAFKCSAVGEQLIFVLPVGLAVLGFGLALVATRFAALRAWAGVLALVLPMLGLGGSFLIAAQDANTPPSRAVVERAERELSARPRFAAQEVEYLAMVTAVRAAVAAEVPALNWRELPGRGSCGPGRPPLDTVAHAYTADYSAVAGGPIPDAAWPLVRTAVLRVAAGHGFTTMTNDSTGPRGHNLRVAGPFDAELSVGHLEGTVITLTGGTFVADTPLPCG